MVRFLVILSRRISFCFLKCLSMELSIHPSIFSLICLLYLFIYSFTVIFWDLGCFFSFSTPYTVGRTLCMWDQSVARPLPTNRTHSEEYEGKETRTLLYMHEQMAQSVTFQTCFWELYELPVFMLYGNYCLLRIVISFLSKVQSYATHDVKMV
jgi:hypothetical protein